MYSSRWSLPRHRSRPIRHGTNVYVSAKRHQRIDHAAETEIRFFTAPRADNYRFSHENSAIYTYRDIGYRRKQSRNLPRNSIEVQGVRHRSGA